MNIFKRFNKKSRNSIKMLDLETPEEKAEQLVIILKNSSKVNIYYSPEKMHELFSQSVVGEATKTFVENNGALDIVLDSKSREDFQTVKKLLPKGVLIRMTNPSRDLHVKAHLGYLRPHNKTFHFVASDNNHGIFCTEGPYTGPTTRSFQGEGKTTKRIAQAGEGLVAAYYPEQSGARFFDTIPTRRR